MPPSNAQTRNGPTTTTYKQRANSVIWTTAERQRIIDLAIGYRDKTPQITAQTAIKRAVMELPPDRRRMIQSVAAPGKFNWFMEAWTKSDSGPIRPAHIRPEAPNGSEATVAPLREEPPPEPARATEVVEPEPEEVPIDLMLVPPADLLRAFEAQMRDRFAGLFGMVQDLNAMYARIGAAAFPGAALPDR